MFIHLMQTNVVLQQQKEMITDYDSIVANLENCINTLVLLAIEIEKSQTQQLSEELMTKVLKLNTETLNLYEKFDINLTEKSDGNAISPSLFMKYNENFTEEEMMFVAKLSKVWIFLNKKHDWYTTLERVILQQNNEEEMSVIIKFAIKILPALMEDLKLFFADEDQQVSELGQNLTILGQKIKQTEGYKVDRFKAAIKILKLSLEFVDKAIPGQSFTG